MKTAPEIVATYEGIEVPDAPHLGPTMIRNMQEGRYEGAEVRHGLAEVREGDRVVEMGSGAGIVGGIVALNRRPARMVSFEANPNLIPHIEALYRHNGIDGIIEVRNRIVLSEPDPPEDVTFFIRGNFLGSGMTITKGQARAVEVRVPVVAWDEVKAEVDPTVLLMDIEGAELEFFQHADLGGIRTIVVEVHRHIYQRPGMNTIRASLSRQGFEQDREISGGGVLVFRQTA
jgi:FkbM family methyltransferase